MQINSHFQDSQFNKTYSRKGFEEEKIKKKKDFEKDWRIMLVVDKKQSTYDLIGGNLNEQI